MRKMKENENLNMRRSLLRTLPLYLALFCLFFIGRSTVKAASLDNKIYLRGNYATLYRDVDGNGDIEKVQLKAAQSNAYFYKNLRVYVDGKLALKKNIKGASGISLRYMSCSAKKNYLQLMVTMDGGYMYLNKIYSFSKGKLIEAADLGQADNMMADVTAVSSNNISVKFSVQPYDTGRVEWTFDYRPKGKKLKLISNTTSVKSVLGDYFYGDRDSKNFKKNKFTTMRTRTYYKSAGGKQKAFRTKKGDIVKMQKVKIIGKKMYLSFKKGKKTGWTEVHGYTPGGEWFRGVSKRLAG